MSEIIRLLVEGQIALFATSATLAATMVVILDCLIVYFALLAMLRRIGQFEVVAVFVAVVVIVLVALEFVGGA